MFFLRLPCIDIKKILDVGYVDWNGKKSLIEQEKRELIKSREKKSQEKYWELSKAIEHINQAATPDNFSWGGENWEGQQGHYRGPCPFHDSKSGTGAWLENSQGLYLFHCTSCTADKGLNLFDFERLIDDNWSGGNIPKIRGKEFVDKANAFLQKYGFKDVLDSGGKPKEKSRSEDDRMDPIYAELSALAEKGIKSSEVELALLKISSEKGHPSNLIQRIYREIESESGFESELLGAASHLQKVGELQQKKLAIIEGLYGDNGVLADKIIRVSRAMPTAPEFLVTTLLPVLSTAIGTSSRLIIHATAGYTVPCIFRSIIVAQTGRKKTPAQKAILGAVYKLEEIHYKTFQDATEDYETALAKWEGLDKKQRAEISKPQPPKRKRLISTDDSLAARIAIHAENPRGLLLHRDEASSFVRERGRFSHGRGDSGELEADLVEFNGGALSRDRKGDGSLFLPCTCINRTGGTQFPTLETMMGQHTDNTGEFARYLFCAADAPPSKIDLDSDVGDIGLEAYLIDIIQSLETLPKQDYLMSNAAKAVFESFQHELTDRAISETHPALEAAYPKFESYFGRLILWLHLVNSVLANQPPEPIVEAGTVELARHWTEYYIGQIMIVLAVNSPQERLTGELLRVYQYFEKKARPLTARDLCQARLFNRKKEPHRAKTSYLRSLADTLVEQGWLSTIGDAYCLPANTEISTKENVESQGDVDSDVELDSTSGNAYTPMHSEPCNDSLKDKTVNEIVEFVSAALSIGDSHAAADVQELLTQIEPRLQEAFWQWIETNDLALLTQLRTPPTTIGEV